MALLQHGNGRSYTTALIIGTPNSASLNPPNYIIEIHATTAPESVSNPTINIPLPDTENSAEIKTLLINLRRITRTVKVEGYIYDTTNSGNPNYTPENTDIVYDHCYIESSRGSIFNGSTGVVTAPANPASDAQNIKSVLAKKWMLLRLATAGAYINPSTQAKEGLTFQWRGIYNPSGTLDQKNDWHMKATISALTIDDVISSGDTLDVNGVQQANKLKVSMTLTWGDPNA